MPRIFVYDGREFPDPDGGLTVEEVKTNLASFMPETRQRHRHPDSKGRKHHHPFQQASRDQRLPVNNQLLAEILDTVPPAHLEILDLAASLSHPNGTITTHDLITHQRQFEDAAPQAAAYADATHRLIAALQCKLTPPPPDSHSLHGHHSQGPRPPSRN